MTSVRRCSKQVAAMTASIHSRESLCRLRDNKREAARQAMEAATGEGIYGIDLEGRFTFINRAALSILGFTREEVLGRTAHQVIHHTHKDGSAHPMQECPIFRAFRTGQGCRRDDEVLWRKDGTSFRAELASYPILQQGVRTGAVVTFIDITERKRAEELLRRTNEELRIATEQAQAADRVKSAFLATMSHELRTLFNSIIGCSETLKDERSLCHAQEKT